MIRVDRVRLSKAWVLDRVKRDSSANKRNVSLIHAPGIRLWKYTLSLQGLVQMLSNSTVCSIGTNKNIAMNRSVVAKAKHHAFSVLLKGEHLFRHVKFVRRNSLDKDVVQFWASKQQSAVSSAILRRRNRAQARQVGQNKITGITGVKKKVSKRTKLTKHTHRLWCRVGQ